ncbi:hypothetical protein WJX77_001509 [Trebouxia sp. C0004]
MRVSIAQLNSCAHKNSARKPHTECLTFKRDPRRQFLFGATDSQAFAHSRRGVQRSSVGVKLILVSVAALSFVLTGCLAQNRSDGADVPKHDHNSASIPNQPGQVRRPFLKVPWGWKEVASISTLWLLAFWILGYWILPCLLDLAGYERDDLSRRGQALVHLILDVGQLGLTIAILWKRLKAYRPRSLGWFETRLLPIRQWLGPVIVAAASFPLLNIVAQQAQIWFPNDGDLWAQNLEHSILNGDPVSNVLYFAVVTFCAPIWEEVRCLTQHEDNLCCERVAITLQLIATDSSLCCMTQARQWQTE